MRLAVRVRHTVTVASSPSGTLATMMPIMNTRFWMRGVSTTNPRIKNTTPRMMAIAEMIYNSSGQRDGQEGRTYV